MMTFFTGLPSAQAAGLKWEKCIMKVGVWPKPDNKPYTVETPVPHAYHDENTEILSSFIRVNIGIRESFVADGNKSEIGQPCRGGYKSTEYYEIDLGSVNIKELYGISYGDHIVIEHYKFRDWNADGLIEKESWMFVGPDSP